jgi:hypothetical protein
MLHMTNIDMNARYKINRMPGVAFFLKGYALEYQPEWWELDCWASMNTPGIHHYPGDHEHGESCYTYHEPEEVEDKGNVIAVMVGDDHEFIVDVSELIKIDEEDYCPGCGQIGCGH